MKNIYILTLFLLLGISCNDSSDVLEENFTRGGFVIWENTPESFRINLLKIEDFIFSNGIEDSNNNITSYNLSLTYGDITVDNFITISSFPNTLSFTGQDILVALKLTKEELDPSILLGFSAIITTTGGVFNAADVDFNTVTNENEGGNTVPLLIRNLERQAIRFNLTLFVPPPKKIRGTSFEEPFAPDDNFADYTRPDGQDVNYSGQLFNIDGLRHIAHTATGNGVDDEIGFTAEFTDDGQSGFSSEEIGVTKKTEVVGAFIDGEQGYQIEDVDGIWTLTFDKVDVPQEITSSGIRVQTFPITRNYGSNDFIHIYAMIERRDGDGSTDILELLNVNDDDLSALGGKWNLVDSGFLLDIASYTLVIETEINSGSEEIFYDEVLIYQPDNDEN